MAASSIAYYEMAPHYRFKYRTTDSIQLVAVLRGQLEHVFNETCISQKNTDLLLLPFYSDLSIHVLKPTKLMIIDISDSLVRSVYSQVKHKRPFNEAIMNPLPAISVKLGKVLYDSIQAVNSEYARNREHPYLVELSVSRLVYSLLNTKYASYMFSIKARHPMEQVKYHIARNINRNIKVSELAGIAGMNSSNFTNTFKRNFGMTPKDYIVDLKMKLAEELLREGSVTEVAYKLGFENVSFFIKRFKEVFDMTPKQYQKTHLHRTAGLNK